MSLKINDETTNRIIDLYRRKLIDQSGVRNYVDVTLRNSGFTPKEIITKAPEGKYYADASRVSDYNRQVVEYNRQLNQYRQDLINSLLSASKPTTTAPSFAQQRPGYSDIGERAQQGTYLGSIGPPKPSEQPPQGAYLGSIGPPKPSEIPSTIKYNTSQLNALNRLKDQGVVTESEKQGSYIINNIQALTDKQIKLAKTAGFNIPSSEKGLSFKILESGIKSDSRIVKKSTEYISVLVGQGERVLANTLGPVSNLITGKSVQYRSVSPETISSLRNLSEREKVYLSIGVQGSNYLTNYAVFTGVGVGVSGILGSSAKIVKSLGITTPNAIKNVASEIAKHPKLAQAVLWAPVAGYEVGTVYSAWKRGDNLDKIIRDEALRVGTLTGQIQGLQTGFQLSDKAREWFKTRDKQLIPPEEIFRKYTLETGKLPTYRGKNKTTWSKEFKDLAKKLSAEEYLGAVAPDEYRVWHGTKTPFNIQKYFDEDSAFYGFAPRFLEVKAGKSVDKFPGLFVAPEPSPLRLPGGGYSTTTRLGIPGLGGMSEIASIDALVEVMPSGMTRAQTQAWLNNQVGLRTAYIPPVSMITSEMEAVIPSNSVLVLLGDEWYTNWAGHRVLVNKYALVPTGVLNNLPSDVKTITLDQLTSRLTPEQTYLAFGIVPPNTISSKLTNTQLESLAKATDLTQSEIETIASEFNSSLNEIRTPDELTDTELNLESITETISEIESSLNLPTEPTSPPSEPTEPTSPPSEPTEPTSPPSEPTEPTESPLGEPEKELFGLETGELEAPEKVIQFRVFILYSDGTSINKTIKTNTIPDAYKRARGSIKNRLEMEIDIERR